MTMENQRGNNEAGLEQRNICGSETLEEDKTSCLPNRMSRSSEEMAQSMKVWNKMLIDWRMMIHKCLIAITLKLVT